MSNSLADLIAQPWFPARYARYRDDPAATLADIESRLKWVGKVFKRRHDLPLSAAHELMAAGGGQGFHGFHRALKAPAQPHPLIAPYLVLLLGEHGATPSAAELSSIEAFAQRAATAHDAPREAVLDALACLWGADTWQAVRARLSQDAAPSSHARQALLLGDAERGLADEIQGRVRSLEAIQNAMRSPSRARAPRPSSRPDAPASVAGELSRKR